MPSLGEQLVKVRIRLDGLNSQFELISQRTGEVIRRFGETADAAAQASTRLSEAALMRRRRVSRMSGELAARQDWGGILWPGEKMPDWVNEGECNDEDDE